MESYKTPEPTLNLISKHHLMPSVKQICTLCEWLLIKGTVSMAFFLICFLGVSEIAVGQSVFWTEDFDNPLSSGTRAVGDPDHDSSTDGTSYTTGGANDYFFRTNVAVDAANGLGNIFTTIGYYWRAEDLDGIPNIPDTDFVEWTGIDIAGKTGLQFRGLFGAENATQNGNLIRYLLLGL